jgi:hypothetical protein
VKVDEGEAYFSFTLKEDFKQMTSLRMMEEKKDF